MDQIKKCSLAGISFTLEADAYAALEGYIQSLQEAYAEERIPPVPPHVPVTVRRMMKLIRIAS